MSTQALTAELTPVRDGSHVIKPLAWVVGGAGAVMAVVGGWLGWVELAVPGTLLLTVFLLAWLSGLGSLPYQVAVQSSRRRVMVGGQVEATLTVRHRGPRPCRSGVLRLPVGSKVVLVKVPRLAPGQSTDLVVSLPTERRALLTIGPVQAQRGDPFGLVSRTKCWGKALRLTVYPPTIEVPVTLAGLAKDIEGQSTGHCATANLTFHALRPYQPGDEHRAIHWRSSARLGELMVRQSEDIRRSHLALILSTAQQQYGQAADFELAIQAHVSMALAQIDRAGAVAAVAGQATVKVVSLGHGAVLDQAAGLVLRSQIEGGETLAAAGARSGQDAPGATLAVMLVGAKLPLSQLRQVAQCLPREAQALGLRCQAGASPSVVDVGGLPVATLGRLADLPVVLRRMGLS